MPIQHTKFKIETPKDNLGKSENESSSLVLCTEKTNTTIEHNVANTPALPKYIDKVPSLLNARCMKTRCSIKSIPERISVIIPFFECFFSVNLNLFRRLLRNT